MRVKSGRGLVYRLLLLLASTWRSLATSPEVTGCIAPRCAMKTDRALLRYLSKRKTSLRKERRGFEAKPQEQEGGGVVAVVQVRWAEPST